MLYYGMVLAAVAMFGLMFFYNGKYQQLCGSGLFVTFVFTGATNIVGAAALLIGSGFHLACTPFTALIALCAAINSLLFSYCSIRALAVINLSLFSVFSMIGGMALPFAAGILFYNEGLSGAKILCFVLIAIAMAFTVEKSDQKGGWLYYAGIFICNGMSGIYSMLFNAAPFPKASASDYSILSALFRVGLALLGLMVLAAGKEKHAPFQKPGTVAFSLAMCGVLGAVANYLLLIALTHIPGSMQYPLVTGGTMIASTLLGFLTAKKPRKRDIFSVGAAFLGMLALLLPF